ncbi:MAG: hypothetical protein ACI4RP_02795, partial [Acutalibacteraceae bacterium]
NINLLLFVHNELDVEQPNNADGKAQTLGILKQYETNRRQTYLYPSPTKTVLSFCRSTATPLL